MKELKAKEVKKELEGELKVAKKDAQIKEEASLPKEEREAKEAKRAEDVKKAEKTRLATEKQAKEDTELLAKKDEELDDTGKKKKAELVEAKNKEEESKLSGDEKAKRVTEKMQKRIDELSTTLKITVDKNSKEAQALKIELDALKAEKDKPGEKSPEVQASEEEATRRSEYLEKDKSLAREKRREMDDETLDEWLLEDQKAAIGWIQRREIRRMVDNNNLLREKKHSVVSKKLFTSQMKSMERVKVTHPELDVSKRIEELKGQGKSDDEIEVILKGENKKYATMLKISEEHPGWGLKDNAPEMAAKEMEKMLSGKEEGSEDSEVDVLKEKVATLENQLSEFLNTDEGIPAKPRQKVNAETKLTDTEETIVSTMREAGASQPMIDSAVEKHRKKQK